VSEGTLYCSFCRVVWTCVAWVHAAVVTGGVGQGRTLVSVTVYDVPVSEVAVKVLRCVCVCLFVCEGRTVFDPDLKVRR